MLETADTDRVLQEAMLARDMTPKLFQATQKKREIFWEKFRNEYLDSIKFNSKNAPETAGIKPQVGDVVIIYDKSHKLFWSKGLILELIPSEDGLIRKAKVRVNDIETIKAVNHLYPLEQKAEEAIARYNRAKGYHKFENQNIADNEIEKNQTRLLNLRQNRGTAWAEEQENI